MQNLRTWRSFFILSLQCLLHTHSKYQDFDFVWEKDRFLPESASKINSEVVLANKHWNLARHDTEKLPTFINFAKGSLSYFFQQLDLVVWYDFRPQVRKGTSVQVRWVVIGILTHDGHQPFQKNSAVLPVDTKKWKKPVFTLLWGTIMNWRKLTERRTLNKTTGTHLCNQATGDSDLLGVLLYWVLRRLSNTSVIVSMRIIAPTIGTATCITWRKEMNTLSLNFFTAHAVSQHENVSMR